MDNTTPKRGFSSLTGVQKTYTFLGLILCACAIVVFIIWVLDSSRVRSVTETYMGVSFLALTVCLLISLILRPSNHKTANTVLILGILAAIILPIVGIAVG